MCCVYKKRVLQQLQSSETSLNTIDTDNMFIYMLLENKDIKSVVDPGPQIGTHVIPGLTVRCNITAGGWGQTPPPPQQYFIVYSNT